MSGFFHRFMLRETRRMLRMRFSTAFVVVRRAQSSTASWFAWTGAESLSSTTSCFDERRPSTLRSICCGAMELTVTNQWLREKSFLKARPPAEPTKILYADHVGGQGFELFRKACELDLEGIVAMRKASLYRDGTRLLKIRNPNYTQKDAQRAFRVAALIERRDSPFRLVSNQPSRRSE